MQPTEFSPRSKALEGARAHANKAGNPAVLRSLSTENNLRLLGALLREYGCRSTLEVGLAFGASALLFTDHHRRLGHTAKSHVAIDPYETTTWGGVGLAQIEDAGLGTYLDFRPDPSAIVLPRLFGEGRRFDLIYVDGSHIFEDVFVDAYYGARLLNEGGIIAFDDCATSSVRKVLGFLRSNLREALGEVDLAIYRGNDWRYRVARWLGRTQMTAFRREGTVQRAYFARHHDF